MAEAGESDDREHDRELDARVKEDDDVNEDQPLEEDDEWDPTHPKHTRRRGTT